jgi:hypothetical protein
MEVQGLRRLPNYLVGLCCATSGLDGDNLGSDEAEIVLLGWVVVETASAKVSGGSYTPDGGQWLVHVGSGAHTHIPIDTHTHTHTQTYPSTRKHPTLAKTHTTRVHVRTRRGRDGRNEGISNAADRRKRTTIRRRGRKMKSCFGFTSTDGLPFTS